jgi:hypothetical protein
LIGVLPRLDRVFARAGVLDLDGTLGAGTGGRSCNNGWEGNDAVLAPFLEPIAQAVLP